MSIKHLSALLVALVTVFTAPALAATQVGFAVRDITPSGSLSGICLGGYGSCVPAARPRGSTAVLPGEALTRMSINGVGATGFRRASRWAATRPTSG